MENQSKTFKRIVIDKYTGPEVTKFSDLRVHYGTGQAYTITNNYKKVQWYRNGVQTNIGDIEVSEWKRLAKRLIEQSGEQEIFEQLKSWITDNKNLISYNDLEYSALKLHMSRIFEDEGWCDFLSFNKKYCPERLKTASIVTVVTDCCGSSFKMTKKQVEQLYRSCICCPACATYTTITYTGKDTI